MKLTSLAFDDKQAMPFRYAYKTGNLSPPLGFDDVPTNTASFCLIVHDPDAVSGDFTHWLMWNIDKDTKIINEGELPPNAKQGRNDFGNNRWDGPSPPSGIHRYIFHAYALDKLLDLKEGSGRMDLELAMVSHVLADASLTGLYRAY